MVVSRKGYYSTVFCNAFSPCGNYLVCGDNYGQLSVFNVTHALTIDISVNIKTPVHSFQAHNGCIYSMAKTSQYLISAGSKEIHGWIWKEILHHKNPKPKWTFTVPTNNPFETPETNSITVNDGDNVLIAGCGDNNVYLFDLTNGDIIETLKGHTDYVHSVKYLENTKQVVSAGEDGKVHFWDHNAPVIAETIEPNKLPMAARSSLGHWVSCIGFDKSEDWLVCGGAAHLSVWHLRSKTATAVLTTPPSCAQVVAFEDDFILSGGTEPYVYKWSINGDLRTKFPCSGSSVFSLDINEKLNKVLAIGGSSCKVDISTNFEYRAFSLTLDT